LVLRNKALSNYYNLIAQIYDATRALPPLISEQVTDYILRIVNATPETKFLEPGIGTGLNAIPIVKKGYSYTGVDISKEMMEEICHKLQGIPDNLRLIKTDAASLPLENDFFDVVLTRHILHLIPHWQQALSEIQRVLKPNGVYLHCQSKRTEHQTEFENQWLEILQNQPGFQPETYSASQQEVTQLLLQEGAKIEYVIAAQWQIAQTVGELLDIYQTKPHASCWYVPDDIFPKAMQSFRSWCQSHYKSLDVLLSSDAKFEILVVRDWGCV